LIPIVAASRAAFSAAVCAANGVLFRAPLNPELPADAHEIVSPFIFEQHHSLHYFCLF
jgi:hypothetical protein